MPSQLQTIRDVKPRQCYDEASHRAYAVARAREAGRQIVVDGRTLLAFANRGRWIAMCPHCRSGIALAADYDFAACFGTGCHRTFTSIEWPLERFDIEATLGKRPMLNQNWGYRRGFHRDALAPAETVDELLADNARHRDDIAAGGRV